MNKILIATGGTGGHIYPALVTAQDLRARGWEVFFIGKFGLARQKLTDAGFAVIDIEAEGFMSRGLLQKIWALGLLIKNFFVCAQTVRWFRPRVVLGFGGYSSFPTVFSAVIMGVPSMIHEQNADPGKANRLLGRFVRRIAVTFKDSLAVFPQYKTVWTGCPLRPMARPRSRAEVLAHFGLYEDRKTILIFGGSQGARAINETAVTVLEGVPPETPWQVIHLTGRGAQEALAERYRLLSFPAFVREYSEEMADAYSLADLVIARSGAGTVTELGLLGIPAILIPYPYAGGHQMANARVLERLGSGIIIPEKDLKPDILRDKIFSVLGTISSRQNNQDNGKEDFASDAVKRLVSEVERLAGV